MCGRYYRKSDKQKIAESFHATKVDDFPLSPWDYNVAPTSMQPIIRSSRDTGEREHFSDVPLDRIAPEEVERYKTTRSAQVSPRTKRRVMPATVNRELACLKALFNHVLKSDVPLRNPVSRVKFCEEHNEQTRVLSFDEQKRYLAVATPMLHDVATLMLETGMRPEEVYRIRRENVHLAQGFLVIPYGKTARSPHGRCPECPRAAYGL